MDQTYMKKENVLKLLITMALPMVISMLVNSLYNIVDSFFVAQISEDAMTAISLVFPCLFRLAVLHLRLIRNLLILFLQFCCIHLQAS